MIFIYEEYLINFVFLTGTWIKISVSRWYIDPNNRLTVITINDNTVLEKTKSTTSLKYDNVKVTTRRQNGFIRNLHINGESVRPPMCLLY